MRMTKILKNCLWMMAAFSLMLFALTGCQKDATADSSEVAKKLVDADVSEVKFDGEANVTETIVVEGTKTLSGGGILNVSEDMDGDYVIVVKEGSVLTLDGITINCQKYASAIQVEEGAKLNIRTASINEGKKQNIYNAGTLEIQDGQFSYCGACNLYNKGTVVMSGGTFTSNGGTSKAVVYNKGEFTMSGGTITEGIACNLYVEKGAVAEMTGGTITASGRDGIHVAKGAEVTIVKEAAKITNCGENGITNYGTTLVKDGIFMSNNGSHIENRIGGELTLKGGQFMSAMVYGINNRGTMYMEGGTITGNTYCGISNKGICHITGGDISYNNFRGISNKTGAELYVDGEDIVLKANYSSNITNDLAGYVEIKNVTLNAGSSNNIHNRGTFYAENCLLVDAGSNSVNNVGGYLEMHKVVIDSNVKNNGIYMTGGEIKLYDCEIKNVQSRAIQNAGAKFYAENLTIENAAKSAVGNKTNPNNGTDGSIEIDGLTMKNPQGVYINSEGDGTVEIRNSKLMKTKNSTAVRIYKGTVTLENVEFMGTTSADPKVSIHAIYLTGGKLNINNCTIHDTDSRAIQNASGNVYGKNLTVYNTGGTAIGNKAYEGRVGNITIDGLNIRDINVGSTQLINECSGTIKVTNGTFGVSVGASTIKINEDAHGKIILDKCILEGTQRKDGDTSSSIHAIYPLSGSLEIYDSVIKNAQSRAIQNKGCKITIDGLTVTNCGGVAIGNETGDAGQSADITAANLTIKDTLSSSVVNNAKGTVVTINSSVLEKTPKTNVSATAGTIVLNNTKVLGTTQDDKPSINVSAGAKIVVGGKNLMITNPSFRAVVNHGEFVLEDGAIANAVSTASAGGVYTDGVFVMTGGSITGNESASVGGGVNVVKTGSMIMTGGTISGNKAATKGGAINIESSATCTITGGTIKGNIAGTLANNVHHEGGELALGGNISIEDLYLAGGKYITVASKLSDSALLKVSLHGASGGRVVLQGDSATAVADTVNKVEFVPELTKDLYLDADGIIKSTNTGYVARIGDVYYTTLSEAFGAVPKNGTETTIVVLDDITLNSGITVESGQNVVLTDDGAVRTITRGTDSTDTIISGRLFTVSGGAEMTIKGSSGTDDDITLIIDGSDDGGETANKDSQLIAVGTGNNASKSAATFTLEAGAALQNNKTVYGGAIVTYGTFKMNGGIIRNNRSLNDNAGAIGIQTWGRMFMNGGTITGNSATKSGGAIHTKEPSTSGVDTVFTMTGGAITNNTAGTYGGAIVMQNKIVITGGTISDNVSQNSGNDTGSQGIRISKSQDITIGGSAEIDEIWLSKNDRLIVVNEDLTKAEDASIMVTLEAGYTEGTTVLTGDKVADNYMKFTLPEAVRNEWAIGSDGKLRGLATETVALIGTQEFKTLASAFTAVPTDGTETTIKMVKDVTIGTTITLKKGQNVVLTDNGAICTIKSGLSTGRMFKVVSGSELTLKGSSNSDTNPTLILDGNAANKASQRKDSQIIAAGGGNTDYEDAVVNLYSGVALQNGNSFGSAVVVFGEFNMYGGVVRNNYSYEYNGGAIAIQTHGQMTMSGGMITGNTAGVRGGAIHINDNDQATALSIKGGTIQNNSAVSEGGAISIADAVVQLTGGTITGNTSSSNSADGIWVSENALTVGKAAVIDEIYLTSGNTITVDSALTTAASGSIEVTLEAGYEVGTVVLTGSGVGTSYDKFTLPTSVTEVKLEDDGKLYSTTGSEVPTYVAKIGTTEYATLAAAFAAVPTDGTETTITLVDDVRMTAEISLTSGQKVVLTDDGMTRKILRGGSLTDGSFFTVVANSELTLKGSSQSDSNVTLVLDGNNLETVNKNSMLIDVGTGTTEAGYKGAKFTMEKGVSLQNNNSNYCGGVRVYGQFVMNGGFIQNNTGGNDNAGGVVIKKSGTMEMKDGTIQGNTARNGAGVHIDASNIHSAALTMTGGSIIGNTASNYAGGITAQSKIVITGGTIKDNIAEVDGSQGIRVTNKNLSLGGGAVVDAIWIGKNKGLTVELDSTLTSISDASVSVTMEEGYEAGLSVLSGSNIANNYQKFVLNTTDSVEIGSDGIISEVSVAAVLMAFIDNLF